MQKNNDIEQDEIKQDEKQKDTVESVILKSYLQNFRPWAGYPSPDMVIYKTSSDIQTELQDMAYIPVSDIAVIMFGAGFRVGLAPDHRPAWMMVDV